MIKPHSHVLADTNAIIEAHRAGCWRLLTGHFRMDTVEKCVEECATGNQRIVNPVPVDTTALIKALSPRKVSQHEINTLFAQCADARYLDEGERHLLAYALTLKGVYFICSPDKNCIKAGFQLRIMDAFISLEELVQGTGGKASFQPHFTKKWMEAFRTRLKLETL